MATRNGLFSPTLQLRPGQASENPLGFSVWYVLAKFSCFAYLLPLVDGNLTK
ncbi:hypothetical protein CLV81_3006 [Flagellimonas meridianipacifica]|uniref:Uncharacterized protein n=1 Tax=Flagellimonas meridianipacifica TaxID=1080225 RepID=A0A2T0MAS1_9FLAO|nr:hypothetical protein CLV81_3006 [Allomuricauda pacifica]